MKKKIVFLLTLLTGLIVILISCQIPTNSSKQNEVNDINSLEIDTISKATSVGNISSNMNSPYIQITQSSTDKYLVKLNLRPINQTHYQRVTFTINPEGTKSGWQVNIGDSKSNNGWAGDGSDQDNDAEIQIKDNKLQIYASDKGNSQPLLNTSYDNRINNWFDRQVYFSIKDSQVIYSRYYDNSKTITNPALFALNGQPDNEGPINYEIFAAFNRVIAGEYRSGSGVGNVIINFYDPISDNTWPSNLNVEIESKWTMDEAIYQNIVSAFVDNSNKYGYDINVRWNGIPKKYVDVYYDNDQRVLNNSNHSIRHRRRYEASSNLPQNPSIAQLDNASWSLDWDRVQYKSTPSIISPIWFRDEVTSNVANSTQAENIVYGNNTSSAAYLRLLQDHPGYNFQTMDPRLYVYDYRYRIELISNGEPVYEISLDRVKIEYQAQSGIWQTSYFTECELEILKDIKTKQDITQMYYLSQKIENDFNLTPSTNAKGQN